MKKQLRLIAASVVLGLTHILLIIGHANAATVENCSESSSTFLGLPTWYKYLKPSFNGVSCDLTFNFPDDIGKVLLAITEIILRLGGLIAVIFVIYGGFRYITSQGEPDNTKSARQTIINAIIGALIATIATVIVSFIGAEFAK